MQTCILTDDERISRDLIPAGLLFILFLCWCSTVFGHHLPANEVGQVSAITISPKEITLRYTLQLAKLEALNEAKLIDANSDGKISPEERKQFLQSLSETLLAGLLAEIDGQPCKLVLLEEPKLEWPYMKTFLFRMQPEKSLGPGKHLFRFEDANYQDVSGQKKIHLRFEDPIQVLKNSLEAEKPKNPEAEPILLDPFAGTAMEPPQRRCEAVFLIPELPVNREH